MDFFEQRLFYGNLTVSENEIVNDISSEMIKVSDYFQNEQFEYPTNEVTYNEIDELDNYVNKNYFKPNKEWEAQDKDLNSYLINKSKEFGLSQEESKNILINLSEKLSPLILELKKYWNRARPYQYAYLFDRDFSAFKTVSGNSPSYPSGHSLLVMCWENHLLNLYPNLKPKTNKIVLSVNMGRMSLGVHFPSDIEFSRVIANYIKSKNFRL